jgi:hypothetical protein
MAGVTGAGVPLVVMWLTLEWHSHHEKRLVSIESIAFTYT